MIDSVVQVFCSVLVFNPIVVLSIRKGDYGNCNLEYISALFQFCRFCSVCFEVLLFTAYIELSFLLDEETFLSLLNIIFCPW